MVEGVEVAKQFGASNMAPHTIHALVTTKCSLNCAGCFYKQKEPGEWSWPLAESIVRQAAAMRVKWFAIGGGEPTEWRLLNDLLVFLFRHHIHTAVTTNGVVLRPVLADRVHISHDRMHTCATGCIDNPEGRIIDVLRAIDYYKGLGSLVAINTPLNEACDIDKRILRAVDTVVVLLPKPWERTEGWDAYLRTTMAQLSLAGPQICADSCLTHLMSGGCQQGRTSMAIDQHGHYSVCSNGDKKVEASSLQVGWDLVRCREENGLPDGCILK